MVFWLHGISFHFGNMLKSLREIGDDRWVICGSNSGPGIIDIAGPEAATNCIVAGCPIIGSPGNSPDLDEVMRRVEAQYGTGLETILESSQALYVLIQVIKAAQSVDPTVVKEKWESMAGQTVADLYDGTAVISGTQTYGIPGHICAEGRPGYKIVDGVGSFTGWYSYEIP
jgi:hypothetical protein